MASEPTETFKLPALIGRIGLVATYLAAVLLLGILAGNLYLLVPGHAVFGWLPLFLDATPPIALLLSMFASYINYYGSWRILRRKDEYDLHSDLKSHAADIPAALQGLPADLARRMGCSTALSVAMFAVALVATGLTLAPPPFQALGIATSPTATPTPAPTATPLVVRFALSPAQAAWDCNVSGRAITPVRVTLDNTGSNVAVTWTLAMRERLANDQPWATASSNQGTAPAGQRTVVTITPSASICAVASPAGTDYHADITLAGQGSYSFTYTIAGLKRVAFKITPTQYPSQGAYFCAAAPPPVTITLDNSASNVDVGWQLTLREKTAAGTSWAAADQTQGTAPAGKTSQVTITPDPHICAARGTYHADIVLTSGGSGAYTFTYSVQVNG